MFSVEGKIVGAFGLGSPNPIGVLNGHWNSVLSLNVKIVRAFGLDLITSN